MKKLYVSDLEILAGERDERDVPDNPSRHWNRPRTRAELVATAVAELRESDFSLHDFRALERLRDRLEGEERDLMDRVLVVVEPRRLP